MYEIIKSVILAGGYKLSEIQYKIKKMYLIGDLSEEQMNELFALSTGAISPDAERPETLEMLRSLADKLNSLDERVAALEGKEPEGEDEEYPLWKPWDGMSNDYQPGAIVSHNGKLWESIHAGQNVWEPGTTGTESLWKVYTV